MKNLYGKIITILQCARLKLSWNVISPNTNLHTRIDGVIDTFGVAIDDIKEKQNHTLTKWGIIVAIVVGVVQIAISLFMNK